MASRRSPSILSTLANFLPLPLLLVSLVTSILAATSTKWATQAKYQTTDPDARVYIGTTTRGLFKNCSLNPKNGTNPLSSNATDYFLDCSLPRCDIQDPYDDQPYLCQQIHIAGNFLIAGIVFTGLALLVGILVFGVGLLGKSSGREKHHSASSSTLSLTLAPILRVVWRLFMVLAVVLTAAANVIGAQQLINNQQYDGDFISTGGTINSTFGHWMVGKGAWLAFVGWISSLVAVLVLPPSLTQARQELRRHYRDAASAPEVE